MLRTGPPVSATQTLAKNVTIIAIFLWIGFVCAISFMEAWLKFQAPGVTLTIGLSIGKLVFAALNRVEIVLSLTILVIVLRGRLFVLGREIFFFIAVVVLILQTTIVLPLLTDRIDVYLMGKIPPPSNAHFYFIALEVIKIISLFIFGFKLLSVASKGNDRASAAVPCVSPTSEIPRNSRSDDRSNFRNAVPTDAERCAEN
jgi:hypothetical protein